MRSVYVYKKKVNSGPKFAYASLSWNIAGVEQKLVTISILVADNRPLPT
jgi:hypothetical protein